MSNFTISLGAAICSVTGGTPTSFTPNGKTVNGGGIVLVNASQVDPTQREIITMRATTPVYNASTKLWSDEYREVTFARPVLQLDGSYKMRTMRIKVNFEGGITAADLATLRAGGAQLLFDPELDGFYSVGTM